jgi:outer membrane protein assembly factor BamB
MASFDLSSILGRGRRAVSSTVTRIHPRFAERSPSLRRRYAWRSRLVASVAVVTAGLTEAFAAEASLIASPEKGWPQFRGPRRDGISDERGLLQSWPEGGPKRLWTVTGSGRGFSSPIIAGGRVYVTGDFGEELRILAYDLEGKPLWQARNGNAWLNQYQGARASVTYSDGRLYHENAHGRVVCLDAANGREVWHLNVLERFRGENITWGLSECLVVDERAVYVTAGGRDALLAALDKRDGKVLWQSKPLVEPEGGTAADSAGYAPPILIRFGGRKLIVGCSARQLFCADADTGEVQWTRPRPTAYSVLAMSPVLVGNAVFMTAPFGPPAALHRLQPPEQAGGRIRVEEVWTTELDTAQGGVVHAAGRLFGSYYPRRGGWAAIDTTTGKVLYTATEIVKGAAMFADHRLYALSEDGWMLLLNPTPTEFKIEGRFRLATSRDRDAWAHPVIYDGRLYLRYHDTLSCYDVRAP